MISFIKDWQVLIIPVIVMVVSQIIKLVREDKKFDWRQINSYGGMPSSHTAMLVSLVITAGWFAGYTSALFAVTFIVAAIFVRDAVGIRWKLGFHGKIINRIIRELPEEDRRHFPRNLDERLGHTPQEVLVGAILGAVLTLGLLIILN